MRHAMRTQNAFTARRRAAGLLKTVALLGALLCSIAFAEGRPANVAGTIELVEGDVMIKAKAGATRLAKVNEPVMEGDTIVTFDKAELHLRMADRAYLAVRENSQLTITTYIANGDEHDRSIIDLAKGAFRSVTGWIGQFGLKAKTAEGRKAYQVRTPLVTIGVRGTDHEPTHLLPGDPRGEAGSYDRVYSGRAVMQTSQRTIEVPANRAAFDSFADRRARPRLLASVPAFFVARPHEQRFIERAREGQRGIARERAARHDALRRERGGATKAPPHPLAKPVANRDAAALRHGGSTSPQQARGATMRNALPRRPGARQLPPRAAHPANRESSGPRRFGRAQAVAGRGRANPARR
jgi:hypothetical protein